MPPAEALIRREIRASAQQVIPWKDVMHHALYDPDCGYYRYPRSIGRSGDFYTAVTAGPLYGQLLAQLALRTWEACGCPAEFTILEQGAHDGQLAEDIWLALQSTPLGGALRYTIIEQRGSYLQALQGRLGTLMGQRLTLLPELAAFAAESALIIWNELADAIPCERVRWSGSQWLTLGIGIDAADQLCWKEMQAAAQEPLLSTLPGDLPPGYTTEFQSAALQLATDTVQQLRRGAFYLADYGYTSEEYYHVDRPHGTLRRYYQHRSDDHVLEDLGQADLTAHVNFTHLIDALAPLGWTVAEFKDQGRFLTELAKPWLLSLEGQRPGPQTAALFRQFQTLTHPTHMGTAFRCLLLERS
jgi:SAM-dependent MidA family methyltransferase